MLGCCYCIGLIFFNRLLGEITRKANQNRTENLLLYACLLWFCKRKICSRLPVVASATFLDHVVSTFRYVKIFESRKTITVTTQK